jgi:hypothetical protein
MSVFIPVSTLVRLVLWLAAAGIVAGILLGAQTPAATSTSPGSTPRSVPTSVVRPTVDQPAVEAAASDGR